VKKLAYFLSIVFQPLLMATYLFTILLFISPSAIGTLYNNKLKLWLLLVVFLTTFVMPVISVFVMKITSGISSFHLSDRNERIIPFFFITIFYGLSAFLMITKLNISTTVNVIFITMTAVVLITTLITIFWKISVHSIGMGGVLGILLALNFRSHDMFLVWPISVWVLLFGVIMSSRLLINAHRPIEVYTGAALGILFCLLPVFIFI